MNICHWNGFLTYQSTKSNEHRQWLSYLGRLIYWESPRWPLWATPTAQQIIPESSSLPNFSERLVEQFSWVLLGTKLGVQEVNMGFRRSTCQPLMLQALESKLNKKWPKQSKISSTLGILPRKPFQAYHGGYCLLLVCLLCKKKNLIMIPSRGIFSNQLHESVQVFLAEICYSYADLWAIWLCIKRTLGDF